MVRRERKLTKLRCNSCGHQFEGLVLHEAIQGQRGTHGWVVASSGAYGDAPCPACGSRLIGPGR
jgi:DNA-directed RNA polymerase subunit RPC12/RpoP